MLLTLSIGCLMIFMNLGIQVWAVTRIVIHFRRRIDNSLKTTGNNSDTHVLSIVMLFLLLGHILQFGTWAALFMLLGEFESFPTAFYHSTVNFTSLGYGDIVMSERWRLLGALEAANGVLMFGLTAGLVLSVMNTLFRRDTTLDEYLKSRQDDPSSAP